MTNNHQTTHMRELHAYLINPFDDPKISMAELFDFSSDHLARMKSNPLTVLTPRIAATTTALTGVTSAFTDDELKLGLRKSSKKGKNAYRSTLPAAIGKIAVAVEDKFGEGSAEFIKCFPHGRSLFSTCPDDQLAAELQSLINAVHTLVPTLAAQVETDATALLTGWTAIFTPSETSGSDKAASIAAKNAARSALQLELFLTLLLIGQTYPRQPEKLDLYMQQSKLQPHTQSPSTPTPPPTPPPPAA
jgi:hypothetical protein